MPGNGELVTVILCLLVGKMSLLGMGVREAGVVFSGQWLGTQLVPGPVLGTREKHAQPLPSAAQGLGNQANGTIPRDNPCPNSACADYGHSKQ